MSQKDPAVDELSAIKSRYSGEPNSKFVVPVEQASQQATMFAPFVWRMLAVSLAVFSGLLLFASYDQISSIQSRERMVLEKEKLANYYEVQVSKGLQENEKLNAKRDQLKEEVKALVAETVNKAADVEKYYSMSSEVKNLMSEKERLEPRLAELNSIVVELQLKVKEKDDLNKSLDALQRDREVTQKNLDDLIIQKEGLSAKIKELETALADKTADLAEYTRIKSDLSSLREEESGLMGVLPGLVNQKATLDKEINEREQRSTALNDTIAKQKASISENDRELSEQAPKIAKLEDLKIKIESRSAELDQLVAKYNAQVEKLRQLETDKDNILLDIVSLSEAKQKNDLMSSQLAKQKAEIENLKQKINVLQQKKQQAVKSQADEVTK